MRALLLILLVPGCRWDLDRLGAEADGLPVAADGTAADAAGALADAPPSFVVDASAACLQAWTQPGCPAQYASVANGSCYRHEMANASWDEAAAACAAECAHLAVITDALENEAVLSVIGPATDAWIGLVYQDGRWRWVTDDPFAYQNWDPEGEPQTLACTEMNEVSGTWDGEPCGAPNRYVCEYDGRPATP